MENFVSYGPEMLSIVVDVLVQLNVMGFRDRFHDHWWKIVSASEKVAAVLFVDYHTLF
jgi:hypothetical protein